jgi:hypothetical protein
MVSAFSPSRGSMYASTVLRSFSPLFSPSNPPSHVPLWRQHLSPYFPVVMALRWAVRCLPGLSVLAILILSELALQIFQTAYIGLSYPTGLVTGHNPVSAQLLFVAYSVFIHVVALIFPFRLCRSVWQASTAVREIYGPGGKYAAPVKAKAEDAPAPQQSRSDAQGQYQVGHIDTVHAIMIPSYKEEISVLEETLKVLASHTLATTTYDVSGISQEPPTIRASQSIVTNHAIPIRSSSQWRIGTRMPSQSPRNSRPPSDIGSRTYSTQSTLRIFLERYLGRVATSAGLPNKFKGNTTVVGTGKMSS